MLPLALLAWAGASAQDGSGRIYVRRIEFGGVVGIEDDALRQEMLQLEGAFLDTVALDESLRRLESLPYVAGARAVLRPVEDAPDHIDVVIAINEAPARRYGGGGGWSESLRASLHAYYVDENLLGTGQRLGFTIEGSELRSNAEVSHTNPFVRPFGISRTVELSSRRIERLVRDASTLDAKLASLVLLYGYPLAGLRRAEPPSGLVAQAPAAGRPTPRTGGADERLPTAEVRARVAAIDALLADLRDTACCGSIRLGIDVRRAELAPVSGVSEQLFDWIAGNGDATSSGGVPSTAFSEVDLLVRWRRDTRDRAIFPSSGLEQTLSLTAALPGSEVEYYLADYEVAAYRPVGQRWTARLRGRLGFGAAYGTDTSSLPPYLSWFAGGPLTVRGYRENALGPRDSLGNPYGGNLLLAGQAELLTPWPKRWRERVRAGAFLDIGNVFASEDVRFADASGQRLDYGFDAAELRSSAGVTAQVLIPLGTLRLSYAVPLNADEDHPNPFLRDDVDRLQISIGVGVDF